MAAPVAWSPPPRRAYWHRGLRPHVLTVAQLVLPWLATYEAGWRLSVGRQLAPPPVYLLWCAAPAVVGAVVGVVWPWWRVRQQLGLCAVAWGVFWLACTVDALMRPDQVLDVLSGVSAAIITVLAGVPLLVGFVVVGAVSKRVRRRAHQRRQVTRVVDG